MPLVVDPDGVELATIRELVELRGQRVLDAGCGAGRLSFACAREGAWVLGIDPDKAAIEKARAETPRDLARRLRFEAADAAQIELPAGEFDLVIFSWSLGWIETEEVAYVLGHVYRALKAQGLLLDIHPLGTDMAVRAGPRGLGFVDARAFARVVGAMDERVAQVVADGLFEHVTTVRRYVAERFDTAAEALAHADGWRDLRMPPIVRRLLRETADPPIELIDEVQYRLLRKLATRRGAVRPRTSTRHQAAS